MAWKISTKYKKSIEEVETFTKDDMTITRRHGWRWGHATFAEKPDLSNYDEDIGIDVYSGEFGDVLDHEFDDGCWEDWEYDDALTPEQIEEIEAAWEEDWTSGIEDLGWENEDWEVIFTGPLEVEEVA